MLVIFSETIGYYVLK